MGNELIIQQVLLIRERQKRVGTRKLWLMLRPFMEDHGLDLGRDALFDLLRSQGLLARTRKRKTPRTTFSDHWLRKYRNLIVGLSVTCPNRLWVSDITYIALQVDFAYLSIVTDAYSRMIVGYYLHAKLVAEGCVRALEMALAALPQAHELIHHSDRGVQYCSAEYVKCLEREHVRISMTESGDPRDNAIAERVNGIMKQEFLEAKYENINQASEAIKQAVQIYNRERLHSSVDMMTPFEAHQTSGELKRHWKKRQAKKPEAAAA